MNEPLGNGNDVSGESEVPLTSWREVGRENFPPHCGGPFWRALGRLRLWPVVTLYGLLLCDIVPPVQAQTNGAAWAVFDLGGGVTLEMIRVPAGRFAMSPPAADGTAAEHPARRVTISKPFLLGRYEVTQGQWATVMGYNPSFQEGATDPRKPVDGITWEEAQQFCDRLNERLPRSRCRFGLPTEAQWEYALRAGTATRFFWGPEEAPAREYAWFGGTDGTHAVGLKKPNAWGFFDMAGHVAEWCHDFYDAQLPEGDYADPVGPAAGRARVIRGGNWTGGAFRLASHVRELPGTVCLQFAGMRVAAVRSEAEPSPVSLRSTTPP